MLSAVVVGSGFSGLCAGILLRRAGIHDFVILEKADRLGGTWRENTYPGAACDIASHLYSFSFEPNPRWTRSYGEQAEILAYLEHCADKYGLRPHFRFGTEVTGAEFDDARGAWTVQVKGGESLTARALILGNGALHIPQLPEIRGLDSFTGKRFHSAAWDHGYDLAGKRVAVVGTGASAIQFVPEIAPVVGQLHLFQRTPAWIVPKPDRPISERERWVYGHVPGAHWLRRAALYWQLETRAIGFVKAPWILALGERIARDHLAAQVPDPALRARLTPKYKLGCKRVLLSNNFYPALTRPNVELVTDAIDEVTPRGVRTADGTVREVDALILGTGFRVTEYLSPMRIVGRGGKELNATWRESLRTYLGITVAGFPNMFLLMGPNTGLGHNSMVFMIEAQARYAVQAIQALRSHRFTSLDVKPPVQDAFRAELVEKMQGTVWMSGCTSWYQTPNGEVALWPGFTVDYWRRTRKLDLADYDTRVA
jgi:cation diffusion facilitator CzcD-associated flavoprotein CzcO